MRLARRPTAIIAGVVLGLGALGGISGAALGGIGATASAVEHRGGHGEHAVPGESHGDATDDHDGPVAPARPAPTG